jgi:hypothetical protein
MAVLAGAALLYAAPAARADDGAVRQVVIAQEKKIAPDNAAFAKVTQHLTKSKVPKAKAAATKLIADIDGYRAALRKVHASTSKVAKGRTLLLSALTKQRSGLRAFKTALTKFTSGKSEASVKKSLAAAVRKLESGQKEAARAAKLLGLG